MDFKQTDAIGVYFYDVTSQIESLQMSISLVAKERTNFFSKHFASGEQLFGLASDMEKLLSSMLLLCDSLLLTLASDPYAHGILSLFSSEINMLLSHLGIIKDYRLITQGEFSETRQEFTPRATFKQVMKTFEHQAKQQKSKISYFEVPNPESFDTPYQHLLEGSKRTQSLLPEQLIGDEDRLKQILINLIKNALSCNKSSTVKICSAFDPRTHFLHVQVADDGIGLSETELYRINASFIDATNTGTELG
mmetsp:Transcript_44763/g.59445  ORF Transcript_44763/g.59445 Transcript_44763/m.59445 type:complete len:250 (+) Transcript_44763:291-1040(+)